MITWGILRSWHFQFAFRLLWAAFGRLLTLRLWAKTPNGCLSLWMTKLPVWAEMNIFIMLNFPLVSLNTRLGSLLRVSEWVVGLKQPTRAWKHIGGSSFWECLKWSWWTRMFYGINLLSILDLKQLRKLNLFKNWDFAIVFLLTFSLIGPV